MERVSTDGRVETHYGRCVSELHTTGPDGSQWLMAVGFLSEWLHVVDVRWETHAPSPRLAVHTVALAAALEDPALGRPSASRWSTHVLGLAFVRQTEYRHGGDALRRHVLAVGVPPACCRPPTPPTPPTLSLLSRTPTALGLTRVGSCAACTGLG